MNPIRPTISKIVLTGIVLMACLLPNRLWAQQDPVFTQYVTNMLTIQPAYAGMSGVSTITALSRAQWIGFEGAPNTNTVNLSIPLKSYDVGLGLTIVNDKWGPIMQNGLYADYTYRIYLKRRQYLALGVKAGFNTYHAKFRDLEINDFIDPYFAQNVDFRMLPNFGAGFLWHSNTFFLGASVPKILKNSVLDKVSGSVYKEVIHLYAMGGVVFPITYDIRMKPTFLFRWNERNPAYLDMSANFLLYNQVWIGATYRLMRAYALSFDFNVNSQLRFGYCFDLTTMYEGHVNPGTHEFSIHYEFSSNRRSRRYITRYF